MKPNIRKMKKEEIIWLAEHYCSHGMPFLEHYNCFLREHPDGALKERMGFFDIETTGFYADYDFMLSWCCLEPKEEAEPVIYGDLITPVEITKNFTFDKRIVQSAIKCIEGFDRIIVYNGVDYRFDIPFLRTRALRWDLPFPGSKEVYVEDVYALVKAKLRLSRKRLGNVCGLLQIPAKSLPGQPNIWMKATAGEKSSLDYVYKHNKEDVESLWALWKRVKDFTIRQKRSI